MENPPDTLKAAGCRNVYQENEPVRPDDTSVVRREVGCNVNGGLERSYERWLG